MPLPRYVLARTTVSQEKPSPVLLFGFNRLRRTLSPFSGHDLRIRKQLCSNCAPQYEVGLGCLTSQIRVTASFLDPSSTR
jgi:hypothetical protein